MERTQADFGTVLPNMSLLATIGFAYSVISPVINGLAMLAFILFYFAWKFRKYTVCFKFIPRMSDPSD